MKKCFWSIMFIFFISFTIFFSGCVSNQNTSSNKPQNIVEPIDNIPEPYKKAIELLNKGDFVFATKYLDLTIQDFPNSKYTYNSNFIKSLIIKSEFDANSFLSKNIVQGIEKGKTLFSQNEIDQLENILQSELAKSKENIPQYLNIATIVFNNYSLDKDDLVFPLDHISEPTENTSLYRVNNFSEIGYPVPQEYEINDFKKAVQIKAYNSILDDVIKDNKVSYPEYFYYYAINIIDQDIAAKMLNKVIELTKDDNYNETKIRAMEALKKHQNQTLP